LPERTDQVLALREVDPGLAAHRGVDHAEQRGGHVDDRDPPVVHGRGEPADVGHHPAAHRHHGVGPGEAHPGEVAAEGGHAGQGLGLLAVAEHEGVAGDAGVDVDRDAVLGDDRDAPHAGRQNVGEELADTPADDHLVGPIAGGHADADHGAPHPSSTASTSTSTDRPPTSTTTSATSV
jgi:hypothetical protein